MCIPNICGRCGWRRNDEGNLELKLRGMPGSVRSDTVDMQPQSRALKSERAREESPEGFGMRLLLGDDGINFAAGESALPDQDIAQTTRNTLPDAPATGRVH